MRYDFTKGVEEIIEDDVHGILDEFGITISQVINLRLIDGCDYLISLGILNRKDHFEGKDQFFVLFLHFIDN